MTDQQHTAEVAAIRGRLEAALKGGVFAVSMYSGDVTYTVDRAFDPTEIDDPDYVETLASDIDDKEFADFIAHVHLDIRNLLAAVERLEDERDGIEAALIAVIDDMREVDWHHLSATLNQQVSDALGDKTDKTRRWREFVTRGDHDASDAP